MKSLKKITCKLMLSFCMLIACVMFVNTQEVHAATKLSKTKKTIQVGDTFNLKLKGYSGTKTPKWTTSNKKIVSIKKVSKTNYKLTGKKVGKATITVKVGSQSYTCKVTVKKATDSMSISTSSVTIDGDATEYVTVTYTGSGSVSYTVSDSSIVSCKWSSDWDGNKAKLYFTGLKNGITSVKVTNTTNSKSYYIMVTVTGMDSVLNAYNKVIAYVKKNATSKESGFYVYTTKDGSITYSIECTGESGYNVVIFSATDASNAVSSTLTVSTNDYDNVRITGKANGYTGVYYANPFTLSNSSSYYYYSIKPSMSSVYASVYRKLFTSQARLILAHHNVVLLKACGVTMSDLGFTYF